jgi:hypothetical protein
LWDREGFNQGVEEVMDLNEQVKVGTISCRDSSRPRPRRTFFGALFVFFGSQDRRNRCEGQLQLLETIWEMSLALNVTMV